MRFSDSTWTAPRTSWSLRQRQREGERTQSGREPDTGKDFLLIGAGAVGSYIATQLAEAGVSVVVAARGERVEFIAKHGITFVTGGRRRVTPVRCVSHISAAESAEFVILATKSSDLEEVLVQITRWKRPPAAVLTVQNGVDAPDQAKLALPGTVILAGRVHGFFEMVGGVVTHSGVTPEIAFGPIDADSTEAANELATYFAAADIGFHRSSDIMRTLWEKFLLAAAVGGVGTAMGVAVGRLRETSGHWTLLSAAMSEIAELAAARKIPLAPDCVARTLAFVASFPPEATSSLQRDLMAQKPSEFASLTGAVVRMGQEMGLAQPAHDEIIRRLRASGLLPAR